MHHVKSLRQRTLDCLRLGHYAERTIDTYIQWIERLARYYNRAPDRIAPEEVQDYLLHLIEQKKMAWSTVNQAMAAFRFLYKKVLFREEYLLKVPARRKVTRRAFAYSREEIKRIFDVTLNPKYKALFMLIYGSGLRVSEAVTLKLENIEKERGFLRINQSKGNKDRYTILPERALEFLRIYYRLFEPDAWLFFGRDRSKPLPIATAQKAFAVSCKRAGVARAGIHILRHSFASHLLADGVDIFQLKRFMGHTSVQTTFGYIHVTEAQLKEVRSPIDSIL